MKPAASRWEYVDTDLMRVECPGGWIYREVNSGSIAYVPHPSLLQAGAVRLPALVEVPAPNRRSA